MTHSLVKLSDYGIRSMNYYWVRREKFGISEDELRSIGVDDDVAYIDETVIPALVAANRALERHGYGLMVKDGYRSPKLYKLVQQKRYELDGRSNTDRTLNAVDMPHANGTVLDATLYDLRTGREVDLWDKKDWPDGIFIGYYKNKTDDSSRRYQELQDLLIKTMLQHGFRLGVKNEIWHFEYA